MTVVDHRTPDEKRPRQGNQVTKRPCNACRRMVGFTYDGLCRKCSQDANPDEWREDDDG